MAVWVPFQASRALERHYTSDSRLELAYRVHDAEYDLAQLVERQQVMH